ncbi:MAG: helix-turn-helix domain-containing protein [Pseudomonadota bacterium]
MQKRLIDIKEASEYLDLTVNTLYSWVSQRKIRFVKVGRLTKFDLRDIDRFIEESKVEPLHFDR